MADSSFFGTGQPDLGDRCPDLLDREADADVVDPEHKAPGCCATNVVSEPDIITGDIATTRSELRWLARVA